MTNSETRSRPLSQWHQLIAAMTDCTVAGSGFFATAAYVIGMPLQDAAMISWFAAGLGFLMLAVAILRRSFNPVLGSFLRSSVLTLGIAAIASGLFAVYLLSTGASFPALLPMVATVSAGILALLKARDLGYS